MTASKTFKIQRDSCESFLNPRTSNYSSIEEALIQLGAKYYGRVQSPASLEVRPFHGAMLWPNLRAATPERFPPRLTEFPPRKGTRPGIGVILEPRKYTIRRPPGCPTERYVPRSECSANQANPGHHTQLPCRHRRHQAAAPDHQGQVRLSLSGQPRLLFHISACGPRRHWPGRELGAGVP